MTESRVLTLDRWRSLQHVPLAIQFPHLELIGFDHDPPIVIGSGVVRMETLDSFSFELNGTPEDDRYALLATGRYRDDPYNPLARPRLVGTDADGVTWMGGYTIPQIDTFKRPWTFRGEIESLCTDDTVPATRQASAELIFPLRIGDPMTIALARFVRTLGNEPGGTLAREHELHALGTRIRFAYEDANRTLLVVAGHSDELPVHYAENWLAEPLRILFGQLIFPRLVARNLGNGRAIVWVRRSPPLIRTAAWASLLGPDRLIPHDQEFWRLFVQLLTLVALARDENGNPNFEPHKLTRLYEEIIQASRGSRWVWALTFASCIEALAKMISPKGGAPRDAELTAMIEAVASVKEHVETYDSNTAEEKQLKDAAIKTIERMQTPRMSTPQALRTLGAQQVVSKEQISAWSEIRNAVAHGSLLSPYSTKKEDRKLMELASMMHLLTKELLRQSVP
jgi:hypothetical protein